MTTSEQQLLEGLIDMYGRIIGTPNMREDTLKHAQHQLDRLLRIYDELVDYLKAQSTGLIV